MGTAKRERQKAGRQARLEALQSQQRKAKAKRGTLRAGLVIALIAVIVGAVWLAVRDDDNSSASTDTSVSSDTSVAETTPTTQAAFTYGTTDCPPAAGAAQPIKQFTAPFKLCIDPAKTYTATFDTSEGSVTVALDTTRTPGTTNNFVSLVRSGYYNATKIFRTDPSIDIIQGGGLTNTDNPGYTIPDEGGKFSYSEGDLVMARGSDANSGGGQFFFVTGPNGSLLDSQGTYVTFGKVTQGLDVVKAIIALHQDDNSGLGGKPNRDVTVTSVTITES